MQNPGGFDDLLPDLNKMLMTFRDPDFSYRQHVRGFVWWDSGVITEYEFFI